MAAYPALLPHNQKANIRGIKVGDFHKHLRFVVFLRSVPYISSFLCLSFSHKKSG